MVALQLQAFLMLAVMIYCAIRTYRDFRVGNTFWDVISLLITIAAIATISIPIPTHAVKIDLPR